MALFKIGDRVPDYENQYLNGRAVKGVAVYANDEKVGSAHDLLVDDDGRIRYLVIDTGFWIFGKKVLLPIGHCEDVAESDRIHANGLTEAQVENLPAYYDELVVDDDYEKRVRSAYRTATADQPASENDHNDPIAPETHEREADADATGDDGSRRLRLYEERLVAHKRRQKTGEVKVSKRVVTEQVEGSVPLYKEKIIIEIESFPGMTQVNVAGRTVETGSGARADLYADELEIRKEAVVRQEVTIRKEIDEEVVTVSDTVRREEIEVYQEGVSEVDGVDREASQTRSSASEAPPASQTTSSAPQKTSSAPHRSTTAPQTAYLIFNPAAGQGDPEQELGVIRSALEPEMTLNIHETTPEVGADQLAHQALEAGAEAVLVSGGDGTISSAANAVVGRDVPLGIISRGTANAFANALGLSENIEEACQTILRGTSDILPTLTASCTARASSVTPSYCRDIS